MGIQNLVLTIVLAVFSPMMAMAQNGADRDNPARTQPAVPGTETLLVSFRGSIGATDAEWKILLPKIEKLLALRLELPRTNGLPPMRLPQSAAGMALANALDELKVVVGDPAATAAEITAKAVAVRSARSRLQNEIDAAQKELTDLLTDRQIAKLVAYMLIQ